MHIAYCILHKISSLALIPERIDAALTHCKNYLQLPAHRNAIPLFLTYIDNNIQCSRLQEALRITRGTLQLLSRMDQASQRYRPCVLERLVDCMLLQASHIKQVTIEGKEEKVHLWPEDVLSQVMKEMVDGMNVVDEAQLERKLVYLLRTESDWLRETEYAEAHGMFELN